MARLTAENLRPHQQEIIQAAWDSLARADYCLVYGGKGTFKTSTLTLAFYLQLSFLAKFYKRLRYVVGAMTLGQVKEVFLETFQEQVPEDHYHYHDGKKILYLTKTAKDPQEQVQIAFAHAGDPRSGRASERASKRKRGPNIHGFYLPQGESLSKTFFTEIDSRVRGAPEKRVKADGTPFGAYPNYQLKIIDANPDVPDHWLRRMLLDSTSPVFIGHNTPVVEIKTTPETSAYSAADLEKFRNSWEPHEVARMLDAKWVGASGRVFTHFDTSVHCTDFEPDPSWEWYLGIDWGYNAPACVLWVGVDNDGRCWVYDEVYQSGLEVYPDLARIVYTKHPELSILTAVADNAEPISIQNLMRYYKEQGSHIRCIPCVKGKGSRGDQLQNCQNWLKLDSKGRPKVTFHRTNCTNMVAEMLHLEWPQRIEGDLRGYKELPENVGKDHAVDAWKYIQEHIETIVRRKGILIHGNERSTE